MIQRGINQLLSWGAIGANYLKGKKDAEKARSESAPAPAPAPVQAPAPSPSPVVNRQPDMRPVNMAMDMFRMRAQNAIDQREKFGDWIKDLRNRKAISHSAYEQIKEATK